MVGNVEEKVNDEEVVAKVTYPGLDPLPSLKEELCCQV
jgi:hypothetical protein